ncbi:hypothetical protein Naga_102688g1 [Nannochloropsis gaditana]|uniref:Uncharacterized protein n=1 Tax=Nannochloropsis gaditana TaxID=72520 RepID=W7TMR8_9STRA|nr:hypothetical protein Naga_102688g1 [Nannochloropsis gaditana]
MRSLKGGRGSREGGEMLRNGNERKSIASRYIKPLFRHLQRAQRMSNRLNRSMGKEANVPDGNTRAHNEEVHVRRERGGGRRELRRVITLGYTESSASLPIPSSST